MFRTDLNEQLGIYAGPGGWNNPREVRECGTPAVGGAVRRELVRRQRV